MSPRDKSPSRAASVAASQRDTRAEYQIGSGVGGMKGSGSRNLDSTFFVIWDTLFWYRLCDRLPIQLMDPTENIAPPAAVSKNTMSARTLGFTLPPIFRTEMRMSSWTSR